MKIAIGYKIKNGPWGGGNQFAKSLCKNLEEDGHEVFFELFRKDIDLILLTDPRRRSSCVAFGSRDILWYILRKNPNALVVHRINECDQRKNTFYMNYLLKLSNYAADFTIFIASWLKDLNISEIDKDNAVILNGGDNQLFNINNNIEWNNEEPLKIVTHHWGGNYMKGFDVYKKLDKLLAKRSFRKKFKFTYIGNLPKDVYFRNSKHIKPLHGENLAKELSNHHVYLTASINEPAGMHHIEGALSGLPIIYRKSGALPEYCKGFGIQFEDDKFMPALDLMRKEYFNIRKSLYKYPNNEFYMSKNYINLFKKLIRNKQKFLNKRNIFRNPFILLINLLIL